jgi:hypothetical protein
LVVAGGVAVTPLDAAHLEAAVEDVIAGMEERHDQIQTVSL